MLPTRLRILMMIFLTAKILTQGTGVNRTPYSRRVSGTAKLNLANFPE
jgi:hypothetical protein